MIGLLELGIILLLIAIVAWILGARGVAGFTVDLAKFIIVVAVVLILVFAVVR